MKFLHNLVMFFLLFYALLQFVKCTSDNSYDPFFVLKNNQLKTTLVIEDSEKPYHAWGKMYFVSSENEQDLQIMYNNTDFRMELISRNHSRSIIISNDTIGYSIYQDSVIVDTTSYLRKSNAISNRINNYEYLDSISDLFIIEALGYEEIDSNICYVIKISNNMIDDCFIIYIDTLSYYSLKTITFEDDLKTETYYKDFRKVENTTWSFKQVSFFNDSPDSSTMMIDSIQYDIEFDDTLFNVNLDNFKYIVYEK